MNEKEGLFMAKMVRVCTGSVLVVPATPRYQVTDECGPLRTFWTKAEAKRWMQPWMKLVVLPKAKPQKQYAEFEEALL